MQIVDDARQFLEGFVSPEARIAASVVIILLTVVSIRFLIPRASSRAATVIKRIAENRDSEGYVGTLENAIAWRLPLEIFIAILQLVVGVAGLLGVLVLWGYLDAAQTAMTTALNAVPWLVKFGITLGLFGIGVIASRIIESKLEEFTAASDQVSQHQQGVVYRVLQLCVFGAIGLAALSLWNVNLGGLLIGAGFLGIVVGMAARQTLGALIAGLVLMFSRPFEIGDWILVNEVEGIVTDITIVNTRIRSFDGEEIVMPNDTVADGTIINRTRRGRLRLSTDVGIDYDADVDRAEELAQKALNSVDQVAPAPKPAVIPKSFDDSSIVLELRYWITDPSAHKKWQTKREVVRSVKSHFEEGGIEIPFPQRTLSEREAGEHTRPQVAEEDDERH